MSSGVSPSPVQTPLISDFALGELTPRMSGRIDQPAYYKGCSLLQNFMPMEQGGFRKRPGTILIGGTSNNNTARLYELVVSTSNAFIVEFSLNKIRFWSVGNNTATYVSGQDITTTYTAAEVFQLQFAWSFPYLFITHQNHPVAVITYAAGPTFSYAAAKFVGVTPTYFTASTHSNTTLDTISPANMTAANIGQAVTGAGIAPGTTIASINSASSVVLSTAATATAAGVNVALSTIPVGDSALPFQSTTNYPRCCAIGFQRLFFGNTQTNPLGFWGSIAGIFDQNSNIQMGPYEITSYQTIQMITNASGQPATTPPGYQTVTQSTTVVGDSDGIEATVSSTTDDEILWIVPSFDLVIGTAVSEWVMPSDSTANTFTFSLVSATGSTPLQGSMVGGGLIYVRTFGRKVARMQWQGLFNTYLPPEDLTFFAEHLFYPNNVVQFDFQQNPEQVLWFVRSDGVCVVCQLNDTYGVRAWWRFVTNGTINSVAVVPGANRDYVFLSIARNSGGNAVTTIELLDDPDWYNPADSNGNEVVADYMDCSAYATGSGITTISGLAALNTMTVQCIGNGEYLGTAVVSGGSVTLPNNPGGLTTARAGLGFTAEMQTMRIEAAASYGTSQTKIKAIPRVAVRWYNTLDGQLGPDTSNLHPANFDNTVQPNLYTGDDIVPVEVDYNTNSYVVIQSTLPLPCTVNAIVPEVEGETER